MIGKFDVEDALNRLDKLTQEKARRAVAESLKATHAVDEKVRGVANAETATDNRVAGVDDRVAGVDDRVTRVDKRVAGVDHRVVASCYCMCTVRYGVLFCAFVFVSVMSGWP